MKSIFADLPSQKSFYFSLYLRRSFRHSRHLVFAFHNSNSCSPGFPRASEPFWAAAAQPRATAHPFFVRRTKFCVAAFAAFDFIFLEIECFQVTNFCGFLSRGAMVSTLWKKHTYPVELSNGMWLQGVRKLFNEQECGEAPSTNGWRL